MSAPWALCIDFGTAFSKAAAAPTGAWARFDPSMVRPLMLNSRAAGGNAFLLDSAVFVDEDRVLFGRAALARADQLASKKRMALRSFKTLLSVSDLDRALNTGAPLSIDPHRVFPMRDLIVLYLAYLLAAVERAIDLDPDLRTATFDWRYAAPAWRSGDSAGLHTIVVRLFAEAEAFRLSVGDELLSPDGVSFATINDALPRALENPRPKDMGLIFEATAAAAYTSIGLEDSAAHLIVIDVGAGTTDIAAMSRVAGRVQELPEARVTLKQAGDFIDRIVANLIIDASRTARSPAQQAELWRELMRSMRDIKESLFIDGRALIRGDRRTINIAMRDVDRDNDFREFVKAVTQAYDHGLGVVRDYALRAGQRQVDAIAVGGGASAPFIQALLSTKPPRSAHLKFVPRPATPDWAHAPEFEGNLAPVFPQLAIAIGGALAPGAMLAAKNGVTPGAGARNGIPAGRD